jgi:SAM-dependent methyltransferase
MVDREVIARMVRNEADMAFRRRVLTIFEWLEPRDGDRLLDCACGRGFYLKFVRHVSRCQLVGLELELPYLRIARVALRDADITLVNGDICHLPFPAAYFDKIILSEILEHLGDDRAGLSEAARVLKPGGLIAVTVPNADYPFWWDPINKTLEATLGRPIRKGLLAGIWAGHARLYDRQSLRDAVLSAGLEIASERAFTHYSFPFIHNIVYGFGKTVLEAGLLPPGLATTADRHRFDVDGDANRFDPIRLGLRVFEWFDRRNMMDEPEGRSTVNLCVLARKPEANT